MRDLSEHVTVFVSTVGAPTFDACLHHLNQQDCNFGLQVIENVAPVSKALQTMLNRCQTPYYVQVDEDMLLYPHAIRTLYESIEIAAPSTAAYQFPLYDVHLECSIYGVKIYRHAVAVRYPFRDVNGCDFDQVMRMRRDGYVRQRAPLASATRDGETTLGLHGTTWTPLSIYERYRRLECKRRLVAEMSTERL